VLAVLVGMLRDENGSEETIQKKTIDEDQKEVNRKKNLESEKKTIGEEGWKCEHT